MKKSPSSPNPPQSVSSPKAKSFISEFLHFMLINGLMAWLLTLGFNFALFVIVLYQNPSGLLYAVIFFGISILGQILFLKK